jgi:hypothetical protein
MFFLDGKPLPLDTPFTDAEGVQYPANFLRLSTLEEKLAIGITEEADVTPPDQRFYWDHGIPKDHEQLIQQWTDQTRTFTGTLLAPTDWLYIRQLDCGVEVPANIQQWRDAVRLACQEKISALSETEDTAALAAYVTSNEYSSWPLPFLIDDVESAETDIETPDVVQEEAAAE